MSINKAKEKFVEKFKKLSDKKQEELFNFSKEGLIKILPFMDNVGKSMIKKIIGEDEFNKLCAEIDKDKTNENG